MKLNFFFKINSYPYTLELLLYSKIFRLFTTKKEIWVPSKCIQKNSTTCWKFALQFSWLEYQTTTRRHFFRPSSFQYVSNASRDELKKNKRMNNWQQMKIKKFLPRLTPLSMFCTLQQFNHGLLALWIKRWDVCCCWATAFISLRDTRYTYLLCSYDKLLSNYSSEC